MAIILQGMCYSGKTTLGQLVADGLGLPFVDAKDLFMRTHGMSAMDYLRLNGRDSFRAAERETLQQPFGDIVLSLSGSAVYYPKVMTALRQHHTIIWLHVPLKTIEERKETEAKERPIIYPEGIATFRALYAQRAQLYPHYSTVTIEVPGTEPPSTTRDKILAAIQPRPQAAPVFLPRNV